MDEMTEAEKEYRAHPLRFIGEMLALRRPPVEQRVSREERKMLDAIASALKKIMQDSDVYMFDHHRVSPDVERQIDTVLPLIREWKDKYGRLEEVV